MSLILITCDGTKRAAIGWCVEPREGKAGHGADVMKNPVGVRLEELTTAKGVTLSEVAQRKNGRLWLGSVELDYIGLVP